MTNDPVEEPSAPPTGRHDGDSSLTDADNSQGYPSFDLRLVPTYTNNQLRHYHISGATIDVDKAEFKKQMEERKAALELVDWDGNTRENTPTTRGSPPPLPSSSHTLSFDHDSEADSECPVPRPGLKGIKLNPSDITRLRYDSNVAQFNNWLEDLKSAYDGDPAKYPTSRQKIILASMTIDDQLKTTYNSTVRAHPSISTHWRKFKRWIQNVVLHGDSDRLKLSSEFTAARQRANEDPNQFYLRLFNLGIQSGRSVGIEDYRTRLVKPLQNIVNQQDRSYSTVQDLVAHAGRLWQTLDPDRVRLEIKEDKERAFRQRKSDRFRQSDRSEQRPRQFDRESTQESRPSQADRSLRASRPQRGRQDSRQGHRPRLSSEERRHRTDHNLCYNCGHAGHCSKDCTHPFNAHRVAPRDDKPAKVQSFRGQKRPRAKTQPVHASEESDVESVVHTTDDSDHEQRGSKRQKN